MKDLIQAYMDAIAVIAKRATLKDARHALAEVERPYGNGTCYGHTTNTKADFIAYCKSKIYYLVEDCHAEALEMNAERSANLANEVTFADDHRSLFVKCDPYVQGLMIEDAHTEALAEDKARRLAARTGFTVEECHAELIAEEGNFLEARCNLLGIIAEAHAEALEVNQGIDEALKALGVTISSLPEEADTGRYSGNTQEHIQKKFGVWIPYSMLADLIERAAHACN
ncbi:hypothetical protein MXF13_02150 [Leclercia adecarboxylata]|uniref:hypothetical protein n=1 Tax=Leclercia adecarboxylata TaxID=83655 RepID=UPI002DB7980E|nr:hypothetical protein [Leclercia adecarboxylata]MEB5748691.1 hypothetical protein [Leclercia adecarboxylata]